ncbi:MAG: hypothetical protein QXP23_01475 [Fervidicoccaceae archaeon]
MIQIEKVVKIGGSLLFSGREYIRIAERISEEFLREKNTILLVVSAARGITDELIDISAGNLEKLDKIRDLHLRFAEEIGDPEAEKEVSMLLNDLQFSIFDKCLGRQLCRELILSFGERLSAALMAGAFRVIGKKPAHISAIKSIVASQSNGDISIDYEKTSFRLREEISAVNRESSPIIIEGFIASLENGRVTTLGRGGSDYTATAVAGALSIEEVQLITETSGIMSCDPKLVRRPKKVDSLEMMEAKLASLYGVKRLHPKTLEPAELLSFPRKIIVRSISGEGTNICGNGCSSEGVKVISMKELSDRYGIAVIGKNSSALAMRKLRTYDLDSEKFGAKFEIRGPHLLFLSLDKKSPALELLDFIHENLIWGAENG